MRDMFIAAAVLVTAAVNTHAATLAVRGRANATPSIAAAGQFVVVAWGATPPGGAADVYAAVSRDGGRTFGSPVRVNAANASASLGAEQPPRVSLIAQPDRDPEIVVVWTAKSKDGTRLLVARSARRRARRSHVRRRSPRSEAPGNRGWESTAVDRNGHIVALWLDHRELAAGAAARPPCITKDTTMRRQPRQKPTAPSARSRRRCTLRVWTIHRARVR